MTLDEKIVLLHKTDLFSFYDDAFIQKLIEHCREVSLEPDQILFKERPLETRCI